MFWEGWHRLFFEDPKALTTIDIHAPFYTENLDVRLASSGLVYKHFGQEIIENSLNYLFKKKKISKDLMGMTDKKSKAKLTAQVYDNFFATID